MNSSIRRFGLLILLLSLTFNVFASDFVGADRCKGCHLQQFEAWQDSHHQKAMALTSPESVLGDFGDIKVKFNTTNNRFFTRGEQYWVNIQGPDGQMHDYQIKYTFGYQPLQQYMVEFDDGRVQLIPFAWDSRLKAQGGQRWFYLYPEQSAKHQEFYWTNTGQNWNYMCADCHSTNVNKNYDLASNTYNTTFSEINVACEACHGPASEHLRWADSSRVDADNGFDRNLAKPVTRWLSKKGLTTLVPEAVNPSQQALMCAQCHSRHVQISDQDHLQNNSFGDRYLLNLIDAQRYYPDGQVFDEDYVYGSFLQSKMNKNGVVCSNCHDPHSGDLTVTKESLCLQCHQTETYAVKEHHHHPINSTGAQCVNCHMPSTTYMQVDDRRDHGWHIPRPDLALSIGTPDTCLSCHQQKDSVWSEAQVSAWRGKQKPIAQQEFAPVFAAIDRGYAQAANALSHIAQNTLNADIIRASALQRMQNFPGPNSFIAITRAVKSNDENIRIGAVRGAGAMQGLQRWQTLAPLLKDPVLAVRTETVAALAPLWQQLNPTQQQQLEPAIVEYLAVQDFNADRGFSHTNKANILVHQGQYVSAEQHYKNSITIDPRYDDAYINLAELYRLQSRPQQTISTLKLGAMSNPDNGNFPYRLGLAYIREKDTVKAVALLNKAIELEPENAHFHYVYGLSLDKNQPQQAELALAKAYEIAGDAQHLYALCEMKIRHQAFTAKQCLKKLATVIPKDAVAPLQQQLKSSSLP